MSVKTDILKTITWPYIRHNEYDILDKALIILSQNGKLPVKMAQDVEFIVEKYA